MTNDFGAKPLRLEYLDGLRGLAALLVVLLHTRLEITWDTTSRLMAAILWSTGWMEFGRSAVSLFIVLSGYCLMLPVVRSETGSLRGGLLSYLKRRGRRILPPYYAALAVSLAVMAVVPYRLVQDHGYWRSMWPAFTPTIIGSHLLLIHNLSAEWIFRINAPLWSVATEWQIYFLFPLILLPVWRRAGILATIGTGFLVGLAPIYIFRRFEWGAPWFAGLFAMGMAAAVINFSTRARVTSVRERIPWFWASLLFACATVGLCLVRFTTKWTGAVVVDFCAGIAASCLLVHCTKSAIRGTDRQPASLRLFTAKPIVGLGAFSYSLYLMHVPILGLLGLATRRLHFSGTTQMLTLFVIGVPLCVALCFCFYYCFERPFCATDSARRRISIATK